MLLDWQKVKNKCLSEFDLNEFEEWILRIPTRIKIINLKTYCQNFVDLNPLGSRYWYYQYRGCLGIRTRWGLEIGMDTETTSISVLLGSGYPYKALIYVQREGSRNLCCMDKIGTLSESQRAGGAGGGVTSLVRISRPQCTEIILQRN